MLPPAGPHRPTGVPADYVVTPFGYFHPSCVLQVRKGESLDAKGVLHQANGSTTQISPCRYPRFNALGKLISGTGNTNKTDGPAEQPSIGHAWIEDSNTVTSPTSAYGKEVSTWTVPPLPLTHDGQTIYFFPGFEDYSDQATSILQPVIGSYNGDQWTMSSWNCCMVGVTAESTPVAINPGDSIVGTSVMTCAAGTVSCATWNVITQDTTINQSTELSASPSEGQTFNWGFGGVLEVYSVNQCLDYPPDGSLTITSLLYDSNLNQVSSPSWANAVNTDSSTQPQCDYNVTTTATATTLTYGTTNPSFGLGIMPAAAIAVNQGSSASGTITITDINGFTGTVDVAASNLPSGITAQVAAGSTPNTYTLTLTASSTAAITGANQPAALTLTATGSGVTTQTFPVNVIVNPPLTGGTGTAVDLSSAFNVYSFYDDSVGWPTLNYANSLDGSTDVYSANQLNPPGLTPMGINVKGVQFNFGKPNEANAVSGINSNVISLPAVRSPVLQILGTAVNGVQPAQTITVTYADNTTQTFTQTFDDWSSTYSCTPSYPCADGESVAVAMPYIDNAYEYPRVDSIYYLYSYSFALDSSKTLKSLAMPNNQNVVALAATLLSFLTPSVTVKPGSSSISTTQALPVAITVSGGSGNATPTGTVTLTSGSYTSVATTLSSGSATITIPAGSLALGNDTLTVSYSGDSTYAPAAGTASVTVVVSAVTVSPASLSFASQNTGSTSGAQTVTLTNSGTAALSMTSVAASTNFAETNTCGSSVAAGASCTISVTFAPTAGGSLTGTITITDSAPSSPQSVALTGTGATLTVTPPATGMMISSPGGSATANIQVTSVGGFSGTANLTCSVSYQGAGAATDAPTCSLNPAQVQVSSGNPATPVLTVNTTAASSAAVRAANAWLRGGEGTLAALLFFGAARRRRWRSIGFLIVLGIVAIGCLSGCGKATISTTHTNPGTTTGNYSVTVTATSGTVTASAQVPLSVE